MEPSELTDSNRATYGRYFGICTSYHHSKGCLCIKCPSYQEKGMMFCARKNQQTPSLKAGCLCLSCHTYEKFRLEGDYFCFIQ
ncbi:Protein of unknown function (DUF2769) [Methanomethylovorans hollandica DSM 15978]|uniref:DUF2769 domain-containing protein n=1 Tax=Methanomethylovorans hollandica (strain DSM 15978 / NBRC 107637 / DMS1) TaxID=867904 RepID=L0KW82_METHD|nr:DUF2769 domain-containing protein [Methanomethylovorans hollandica]AGB48303.1 Protein of unknown function (DUF2769) [Methanomethylovorans hollandica DSM 15978]